jgi:tetratricopeptide (TPR) repeat protein
MIGQVCERLESLGYLVPEAQSVRGRPDLGVVGGPDPKDHIDDIRLMNQASTLIGEGQVDRALEILMQLETPGPRRPLVTAVTALLAKKGEIALTAAQELLDLEGPSQSTLSLLAMALLASKRPEDARRQLEAARELGGDSEGIATGLGMVAEEQGNWDEAETHYSKAKRLAEKPGPAHLHLAILRVRQGRFSEADALLAEAPPAFLAEPRWLFMLADAEEAAGRPDRALGHQIAATQLDRVDSQGSHFLIGYCRKVAQGRSPHRF